MGLKRRVGAALHRTRSRLRPPASALVTVNVAKQLGLEWILDIGANRGQFAERMRRVGFDGRILSLEPVSDAFAQLAAASADDPRWTIEQTAVGATPGTATIHVAGNSVSSSMLPMEQRHLDLAPQSAYGRDEEVPVTTVLAVLDGHGIDPASVLLKADVQGYEAAVLDGAGDRLPEVAALLLELSIVPFYEGQPLLPEMLARLTASGHLLWNLFPEGLTRHDGRLLWGDGLFVRADLAPEVIADRNAR